MKPLQLDRRDKIAMVCAGLVLLLVLFMALYLPSGPLRKHQEAQRALNNARQQLTMWQQQKQEQLGRLESQEEFQQRLAARPRNFQLISFVDQMLIETGLKGREELSTSRDRAAQQQPMADLKLNGVSLEELVNLLHRIHSSGNLVAVYKIDHIRPARDERGLDLSLTLVTVSV
jgi:type II secretory pathway component PulM